MNDDVKTSTSQEVGSSLSKAKKQLLDSSTENVKQSKYEVNVNLANAVLRPKKAYMFGCPRYPKERLAVIKTTDKDFIYAVYDVDHKELTPVKNSYVETYINRLALLNDIPINATNQAGEIRRMLHSWGMGDDEGHNEAFIDIKDIPILSHLGEDCFSWRKIPFNLSMLKMRVDQGEDFNTPVFDEFCSRIKGVNAFKAFIGSIFDRDSGRFQYLWIHGSGGNGKSAFLSWLNKILKSSYCNSIIPGYGREHFWTTTMLGRRVVAFPDTNSARFVKTGFFKSISGDDVVAMERKGQDSFNGTIECKFIFSSNKLPVIGDNAAERRRAIIVEVGPLAQGTQIDVKYVDKLMEESEGIIAKCLKEYWKQQGTIVDVSDCLENIEKSLDIEVVEKFENYLESFLEDDMDSIVASGDLYKVMSANKVNTIEYGQFLVWLKQEHGYKITTVKGYRRIYGLRMKDTSF